MSTIITILTEGFADWESALLTATARGEYGIETRFATPGGAMVTSIAGLRVTPDLAVEDIDVEALDVLVINGGTIWLKPEAPDLGALVRAAAGAGKLVAGICDGTQALARAGVLDAVAHTSNGPDSLPPTGYKGAAHYRDTPHAVSDGGIVTAPGTAPVSFMAAILGWLGKRDDMLDMYLSFYAAEHPAPSYDAGSR